MLENGSDKCTCRKKSCERHGKCAECIEHHKTSKYEPYCKRKKLLPGLFDKTKKK